MKPYIGKILFATACTLLYAACAAAPAARPTLQAQPGAPEQSPPKPKMERIVTERVPILVKEIVSLPDGVQDTIRNLSYDQTLTNPSREDLSDASSKEVQETVFYSFREDRLIERKVVDAKNRQKNRKSYSYNAQGQVETESSFDAKDLLQAISRYAYDQKGRKIEWTTLDGGQGVLATTKYIYQGENLDKISLLGVSGKPELEISMEYDPAGRKILETFRTAAGAVEKQNVSAYDQAGRLSEEKTLSPSKIVLSRNALSYVGESRAPSEIRRYDSRGGLKDLVTREYAFKEVKKVTYE